MPTCYDTRLYTQRTYYAHTYIHSTHMIRVLAPLGHLVQTLQPQALHHGSSWLLAQPWVAVAVGNLWTREIYSPQTLADLVPVVPLHVAAMVMYVCCSEECS